MLFREYIQEACEMKEPFEFSYIKPLLDWYETKKVSILYNQYDYLSLQRRYGASWWLIGHRYNEHLDKWEGFDIGEISNHDIRRLVEWARFTTKNGNTISILTSISTIDAVLNPIDEFLKNMQSED